LVDLPHIIPERDEFAAHRRQPGVEAPPPRKAPSAPLKDARSQGSGWWKLLAVAGLVLAIAAATAAAVLFQQTQELRGVLAQSNLRIADLEGRLSSTDDSVNQSSAAMQVKLKDLAGEVDKLWASAWRKNGARIDGLEATLKKTGGGLDADRKRLGELAAAQTKLQQRIASAEEGAGQLQTLKEQQAGMQSSIGRLNSTMNTLASTQKAQEARLKDSEQWQQSNIEFRRQVNQRLTRLENPAAALQP
jgi:chromosome segregation ATPase